MTIAQKEHSFCMRPSAKLMASAARNEFVPGGFCASGPAPDAGMLFAAPGRRRGGDDRKRWTKNVLANKKFVEAARKRPHALDRCAANRYNNSVKM